MIPEELAELPACQTCLLCVPAINRRVGWLVLGEGSPDAGIVLIGEALGEEEEKQRRPFVGPAGDCLDLSLRDAGLLRHEVWITNAVRCRPRHAGGANRPPKPKELAACRGYLDEELATLARKQVIVAMGASAMWAVFHPGMPAGGVAQNEGRVLWSERYRCWVVCTIHPAFVLRRPAEREFLVSALVKARRIAAEGYQPPPPVAYSLVRTREAAESFRAHALAAPRLYFDWETNGLHLTKAIGFCLAVCLVEGDGTRTVYVIPRFGAGWMPVWGKALGWLDQEILIPALLSKAEKGGHNVAFDMHVTQNTLGIWPRHVRTCTMLKSHLVDNHFPERAHGLKRLSDRLTPYGRYDEPIDDWLLTHGMTVKDAQGSKPDWGRLWEIPNQILWPYAAADSLVTALVDEQLDERLHEEKLDRLYHEERMPALFEYLMIDRTGLRIDAARLDVLGQDLDGIIRTLGARISEMAGHPLNPHSHPQVADHLFTRLGLPVVTRTETGAPSVGEEVLRQLADQTPIATMILHARGYAKLKTTFVDGGKRLVGGLKGALDEDGRARTNTILIAAETFRLATRRPFPIHVIPRPLNVFNCETHGLYQYERCCEHAAPSVLSLRGLIVPDPGWVFLSRDLSQQEFAIQAVAAGEQDLEEAIFDRAEDAHEYVMAKMFGQTAASFGGVKVSGKWVFPDEHSSAAYKNFRTLAKSTNFAALFRAHSQKLGKMLGKSEEEAGDLLDTYDRKFGKIRGWQTQIIQILRDTGRVTGLYGTHRSLPGIYSPSVMTRMEAERQACNFPIQEAGFRYMIRALIRTAQRFRGGRLPWQRAPFPARIAFSVHDEIVATCRADVAEEADAILQQEMERPQPELTGACGVARGIRSEGGVPLHAWG